MNNVLLENQQEKKIFEVDPKKQKNFLNTSSGWSPFCISNPGSGILEDQCHHPVRIQSVQLHRVMFFLVVLRSLKDKRLTNT